MLVHTYGRGSLRLALALAGFSWQLGTSVAAAEPTASERETVRSLMDEGDRLRASGDLRGALVRYQGAHAIVHAPTTGLDLARVQAQLGLLVEARSTASEVIHLPAVANEPKVFSEARAKATELARDLEAHVPALKTEVQPSSAQHTVSIDGVVLPAAATQLPYKLNPGPHSVRVEAPGYLTENRQVNLDDSQTLTVSVVLTAAPSADSPTNSQLAPSATARASVVPAALNLSDDGAGEAGRLRGYVGLGVGGSALVLGGVTGILALTQGSDLRDRCPNNACSASDRGSLSSVNTLANISNISLPVGVLGIAYGLFELLTLPERPRNQGAAAAVAFELNGLGANVRGSL